jgi:hypothetical protein
MLPNAERVGETGLWLVPDGTETREIEARFVGFGTSRAAYHVRHDQGYAPAGMKCQACRWMEIRIFDDGNVFLISYAGRTEVPGETQRYWTSNAGSEDELVDLLSGEGDRGRFFSKPARLAVESARKVIPEIGDAYEDHPGHPVRAR